MKELKPIDLGGGWTIDPAVFGKESRVLTHECESPYKDPAAPKPTAIVDVEGSLECWLCGLKPPTHILDIALMADVTFIDYTRDFIEECRAFEKSEREAMDED